MAEQAVRDVLHEGADRAGDALEKIKLPGKNRLPGAPNRGGTPGGGPDPTPPGSDDLLGLFADIVHDGTMIGNDVLDGVMGLTPEEEKILGKEANARIGNWCFNVAA